MQAIRACVAGTERRDLKEPIPVADIPRCYSFYSPAMSDDSGRNSREETTGSTGDKKSTPLSESGTTGCGEEREIPQPETLANSDTSDHRSRSGSVHTTTNGRLDNADFGFSAPCRTESVSRECTPGMDDVSVMWSPLESKDRPGRHSGKDGTDNRSTSTDTSLYRMCIDDATATDDKTKRRRSSDAVGFSCAKEWYTHL